MVALRNDAGAAFAPRRALSPREHVAPPSIADAVAKTSRVVDCADLDERHRAAGEVHAKVVFAPGLTHRPGGGTRARGVRTGTRDAQREERRVDVLDEEVEVAAGAVAGEARPRVPVHGEPRRGGRGGDGLGEVSPTTRRLPGRAGSLEHVDLAARDGVRTGPRAMRGDEVGQAHAGE